MNTKMPLFFKVVALFLVVACVFPMSAMAVEPRASDYLSIYGAYIYPAGWGKVQVWFEVDGTRDMDEIGALEIKLYESKDNETWTWVMLLVLVDRPCWSVSRKKIVLLLTEIQHMETC